MFPGLTLFGSPGVHPGKGKGQALSSHDLKLE
jgi:hypothetical protein